MSKQLTIDEVRINKQKLEKEIHALICCFKLDNNVEITEIGLKTYSTSDLYNNTTIYSRVVVEIIL